MKDLFELVGKMVAYVGGAAAVAYLTFSFLGKKTIDSWFAKRLKKFEYDLNSIFNRVSKIHEKEFEVLPEAWKRLDSLLDSVRQFIRDTHCIPELDEMSSLQLEEFLSKQDLTEAGKQNIRGATSRKNRYFYEKSERAGNACLDFQDYIAKNAIFLSSDLKSEFKKAEETVRTAWAIRKTAHDSKDHREGITEACQIMTGSIPPIMERIEGLVQKRLRFFDAQ